MGKTSLKIVANDYTFNRGFIGEHGNSILLENDYGKVLFDTGQGLVLKHNLKAGGWQLDDLDAIAISHGHFDHIGGLVDALEYSKKEEVPVYGHQDMLAEKFKVSLNKEEIPTGSPYTRDQYEKAGAIFVFNDGPIELIKGMTLTGPVARKFIETDTREHFQIRNGVKERDPFNDDQSLIVETDKGLVIVFGCAHAGVINTMDYVAEITGEKSFYGLLGGTHLLYATEEVLENTLREINKRKVKVLGLNHCTGLDSIAYFRRNFSNQYISANTGDIIEI